jgi:hypothetical protein
MEEPRGFNPEELIGEALKGQKIPETGGSEVTDIKPLTVEERLKLNPIESIPEVDEEIMKELRVGRESGTTAKPEAAKQENPRWYESPDQASVNAFLLGLASEFSDDPKTKMDLAIKHRAMANMLASGKKIGAEASAEFIRDKMRKEMAKTGGVKMETREAPPAIDRAELAKHYAELQDLRDLDERDAGVKQFLIETSSKFLGSDSADPRVKALAEDMEGLTERWLLLTKAKPTNVIDNLLKVMDEKAAAMRGRQDNGDSGRKAA